MKQPAEAAEQVAEPAMVARKPSQNRTIALDTPTAGRRSGELGRQRPRGCRTSAPSVVTRQRREPGSARSPRSPTSTRSRPSQPAIVAQLARRARRRPRSIGTPGSPNDALRQQHAAPGGRPSGRRGRRARRRAGTAARSSRRSASAAACRSRSGSGSRTAARSGRGSSTTGSNGLSSARGRRCGAGRCASGCRYAGLRPALDLRPASSRPSSTSSASSGLHDRRASGGGSRRGRSSVPTPWCRAASTSSSLRASCSAGAGRASTSRRDDPLGEVVDAGEVVRAPRAR